MHWVLRNIELLAGRISACLPQPDRLSNANKRQIPCSFPLQARSLTVSPAFQRKRVMRGHTGLRSPDGWKGHLEPTHSTLAIGSLALGHDTAAIASACHFSTFKTEVLPPRWELGGNLGGPCYPTTLKLRPPDAQLGQELLSALKWPCRTTSRCHQPLSGLAQLEPATDATDVVGLCWILIDP